MRIIALYRLPLFILVVDFITKKIALAVLFDPVTLAADPTRTIAVMPFLNFAPVWNPGVSFGFLGGSGDAGRYALTVFALVVGFVLPYYARSWGAAARFGAQLMAAGALGNAIDRMLYGKVVDFIDVYAGAWHWPAFNIADMGITIGAALILLTTFFGKRYG